MRDYWLTQTILSAIGWAYVALVFIALALALWLPKGKRGKALAGAIVDRCRYRRGNGLEAYQRLPTSRQTVSLGGGRRKLWIAALALALPVAGCSRTVQWEEEVPLNTGETIWVKRSGTYTYRSSPGNPLAYEYQPDWASTTEFTYKGKLYSFTESASLILLAIAPDGVPNLVADAANHDWQWKHNYYCITPFYVQFRPIHSGKEWTWPEKIDQWLYGLPTNLVFGLPPLASDGKKFTAMERARENASITLRRKELRSISVAYSSNICPRKN